MNIKHLLCTTVTLLFFVTLSQSQVNIVVSGNDATGSNGSVSYSIGQIDYNSNMGTSGMVTQGVQQPYEIFEEGSLGVGEYPDINLSIKIYPNPTVSNVILSINEQSAETLSYHLLDLNGRLLLSGKLTEQETIIPMDGLPVATYLFNVKNKNINIKSFKIIKNH